MTSSSTFFKDAMSKPAIIAHRGNVAGRDPYKENHPDYLMAALKAGHGIEYDVWFIDGLWILGHDRPEYQVSWHWLFTLGTRDGYGFQSSGSPRAWAHCKNLEAYVQLNNIDQETKNARHLNYFWHEDDLFTTTSLGFMWMHPRAEVIPKGCAWVIPHLSASSMTSFNLVKARWICTDDSTILSQVE